jgi:glucose-6-phosphate dehydrogenase assembly protein OpcA
MNLAAVSVDGPATVALHDIEGELARQMKAAQGPGEAPVQCARMSNLVIFCNRRDQAEQIAACIPSITAAHPARVLLLVGEPGPAAQEVTASVSVRSQSLNHAVRAVSEQITLRASGACVDRLPYAVRSLLIGDLPTNLWWAAAWPPPLAGALLHDLAEQAQQIIYDSIGWVEPARGVAATASWLAKFERGPGQGHWRVASDLNWRRLKYWRRLLAQALDPATSPNALESITEVLVEHGPHAVIQAWELVSWLASRLHWQVQRGRVQPGLEILWQVLASHGALRLRVHRLADGPSEVRRVRIACTLDGHLGALNVQVTDENHLAVSPEGIEAAPRTVTVQPQPLAELIGRQLSDREQDPVFRESMAVAQVLAQSVLG